MKAVLNSHPVFVLFEDGKAVHSLLTDVRNMEFCYSSIQNELKSELFRISFEISAIVLI